MSEPEIATAPLSEHDATSVTPTESTTEPEPRSEQLKEPTKPEKPFSFTFTIWPPTQRTRGAVINRLIETLSTSSILSKRYGTMPPDEASDTARRIEEESYAVADGVPSSENDGIEILQVYSKEVSKRMMDAIKARAASSPAAENGSSQTATPPAESNAPSEKIASTEN